jgi:hypothetical protein
MLDTQKPPPPDDLTKEEAKIWISIVDVLPYDWFSAENYPLLGAYCGHIVTARHLKRKLHAFKVPNSYSADALRAVKMEMLLRKSLNIEHRAMIVLAAKLRLTPSSKNDKVSKDNDRERAKRGPREPFQVLTGAEDDIAEPPI